MELAAARTVLGVTATDGWDVVRDAYRDRIRRSHPDVAGDAGIAASVELNAAYRVLALARREGRLHEEPPPRRPPPAPRGPRAREEAPRATRPEWSEPEPESTDVFLLDRDTLVLSTPPAETFRRLVEAAHEIGDVSYIDRSSAIFEAILTLDDGKAASFVVSLQWRAHDATCEAFCTLEALDRAEQLDVSNVLQQLAMYIPPDRDADVAGR